MSKVSNCTHYWVIDSENVGLCKYCGEVRDFGKILMRDGVFEAAGRRGAEARKEVLDRRSKEPATIAKISAAAKKRWQDPEYRVKMSVARASFPRRHHKKEELL